MKAFLTKHILAFLMRYGLGLLGIYIGIVIGQSIEEWYWALYIGAVITFCLAVSYVLDVTKTKL